MMADTLNSPVDGITIIAINLDSPVTTSARAEDYMDIARQIWERLVNPGILSRPGNAVPYIAATIARVVAEERMNSEEEMGEVISERENLVHAGVEIKRQRDKAQLVADRRTREVAALLIDRQHITAQRDRALQVVAAVQDLIPLWDAFVERPGRELDDETLDAIGRIREMVGCCPQLGAEDPERG